MSIWTTLVRFIADSVDRRIHRIPRRRGPDSLASRVRSDLSRPALCNGTSRDLIRHSASISPLSKWVAKTPVWPSVVLLPRQTPVLKGGIADVIEKS